MMKIIYAIMMLGLLGLTACQEEGPAEEFGRELDDAARDAGDAIDDAVDRN